MKVNGIMDNLKEWANYSLTMGHIIMVLLIKVLCMDKVGLFQALRCIIKDKLDVMWLRAKVYVLMKRMIMFIMDNG